MLKKVSFDCFHGRYWRGVAMFSVPREFRLCFKGLFDWKDEMKSFCKQYGGTWDAVNRCWFVPVSNLKELPQLINAAIEAFGDALKIGSDIEWCLHPSKNGDERLERFLEQRLKSSHLKVVNGGESSIEKIAVSAKLTDKEKELIVKSDSRGFARKLADWHNFDAARACMVADCQTLYLFLEGKSDIDKMDAVAAAFNAGIPELAPC